MLDEIVKETKDQKFKRIAASRTNSVLEQLRLLGNTSNRQLYSYSQEDVNKIFAAIERQLKATKSRFRSAHKKEFSL